MIIDIDGKTYTIPAYIEAKILSQVEALIEEMIVKAEGPVRFFLKNRARHEIAKMEQQLNEMGKDGKLIRPKDGADPVKHYAHLLLFGIVQKVLSDAILLIDSEGGSNAVAAFNLSIANPSDAGGQISFGGYLGERQDNGSEVPGPGAGAIVPYKSPLHL